MLEGAKSIGAGAATMFQTIKKDFQGVSSSAFFNLPPLEKGLVFLGSIFFLFTFLFLIKQIKGYLRQIDGCYLAQLSEFANHNRIQAQKAGHVALHELSFSWLKGVKMRVKTLPIQPRS